MRKPRLFLLLTFLLILPAAVSANSLLPNWHPSSSINGSECVQGSMCPLVQNESFVLDANVTCEGTSGTCGVVEGQARYGNETRNQSLIETDSKADPFGILSGRFPQDTEIDVANNQIHALATDSKYVYVGSKDKNAYVVNRSSGELVQTLDNPNGDVKSIAVDDSFVYLASTDNSVYVFNKTDWTLDQELTNAQQKVQAIDVDNRSIYFGSDKGSLYVVWKSNYSERAEIRYRQSKIWSVDVDDSFVYHGDETGRVYATNKTDLTQDSVLRPTQNAVYAIDHDSNYLYSGEGGGDAFVYFKSNFSQVTSITNATDSILAIDNDNDFLYLGSKDKHGYVINKGSWTIRQELKPADTEFHAIAESSDSLYLGGKNSIVYKSKKKAWTANQVLGFAGDKAVRSTVADTDFLYFGAADTNAYVVDKSDWSSVANITSPSDTVYALAEDSNYLYVGSKDKNVYVVWKSNWSIAQTLNRPTISDAEVWALEVDNNYLYVGNKQKEVNVVDKNGWSSETTISFGPNAVRSVDVDDTWLYYGDKNGDVFIVNKTDWTQETSISPGGQADAWALDHDDTYLYLGSGDSNAYVINSTWDVVQTITVPDAGVRSLSNDRRNLFVGAASKDKSVYSIDKSDWSQDGRVTFSDGTVYAVADDRSHLFIGSGDGNEYVVNKEIQNPQQIGTMDVNTSEVLKWKAQTNGLFGTEWSIDVNFFSSTLGDNPTPFSWVRITKFTDFTTSLDDESQSTYTNADITVTDFNGRVEASETLGGGNSQVSLTDLYFDFNYDIIQAAPTTFGGFRAEVSDYILSDNGDFTPMLVENYSNSKPPRSEIFSVYAVDPTEVVSTGNTTLYFPKPSGKDITGVFRCNNWDFTSASCPSWQVNHTSAYNAKENATHLWFNVSGFSAYGAGNQEPLPNVTNITVYNVETANDKENGGTLVDFGLNTTLSIDAGKQYRFEQVVENEGTVPWQINDSDEAFQEGLDTSWTIDTSNDIWYEVTSGNNTGGSFSNGNVTWNTSLGGNLSGGEGQNGYFSYIVDVGGGGANPLTVTDFPEIPNSTFVAQNHTFQMNATVQCTSSDCGLVNGTTRYNASSLSADTSVPSTNGSKPLYVFSNQNKKECAGSPLTQDENCTLTWWVNATGPIGTPLDVDVRFEGESSGGGSSYDLHTVFRDSSSGEGSEDFSTLETVAAAVVDTADHNITITFPAINVILEWASTSFGALDPGQENNSALGNDNRKYNITVPTYSSEVEDLWIKGTNLTGPDTYEIAADAVSWSLTNNIDTETFLSHTFDHVTSTVSSGTTLTSYYWIDVPFSKLQGSYSGTLTVKANTTQQ